MVFSKVWRLRRLVVAKQFEFLRFNVKTLVGGTPPREVGFHKASKKAKGSLNMTLLKVELIKKNTLKFARV